eukprot:TRINITY_DN5787_c0_g1_i5.p1 TRINITY_DN5787_c0_g1~~TRINITY_DN5787_c0_g1_i5.p1  ORF type:complete len:106 (+),score=4.46 TRINITY_DN5787_c0_g1_i5:3-320(+)
MYLHIDCRLLFSHVLHICIIFILVLKVYARGSVAFFFFQAEDGIRDLVRSRGLGDVYKRQVPVLAKMLFEDLPGNGYYFGSDGVRSPYHFMRSPGEPEYDGNMPF